MQKQQMIDISIQVARRFIEDAISKDNALRDGAPTSKRVEVSQYIFQTAENEEAISHPAYREGVVVIDALHEADITPGLQEYYQLGLSASRRLYIDAGTQQVLAVLHFQ